MSNIINLNDEQLKAVNDTEGYVLVLAGAGSGKTRVLTTRIAHLVNDLEVNPTNILAITFTNKAAREMKERVGTMVENVESMWVSTIHSMCVRMLRSYIDQIGYSSNFSIYDEDDKTKVLKRIIKPYNLEDETNFVKTCKGEISNAKCHDISPEDYFTTLNQGKIIKQVYIDYEEYLKINNAVDFDDLLIKALYILKNCESAREYYTNKFQYILVDEFQDTNSIQLDIIRILASKHHNLFVVGDDDQGIYSWRGAEIKNIVEFDRVFPNVSIHKLEENYRSTQEILNVANLLIHNNSFRKDKTLWTGNPSGSKPSYFIAEDEKDEARYVTGEIKKGIISGKKYSDFAVLIRVNSLSYAFEKYFMANNIPYKVYGGLKFYERAEIKDLLAYLKCIVNPHDSESLLRIINTPRRGIGDVGIDALVKNAKENGTTIIEEMKYIDSLNVGNAVKLRLKNFIDLLSGLITVSKNASAIELFNEILLRTSFLDMYDKSKEEDKERLENIENFKNEIESFSENNEQDGETLSDFLQNISLQTDVDKIDDGNYITVSSIHQVKGLEFDTVFFSGVEQNIIPLFSAVEEGNLEEERRLAYVAITRARKTLYLTRAIVRFRNGHQDNCIESDFIKEIFPLLKNMTPNKGFNKFDNRGYSQSAGYFKTSYDNSNSSFGGESSFGGYSSSGRTMIDFTSGFNSNGSTIVKANVSKEYHTGDRVNHKKFGLGKVTKVDKTATGQLVTVEFDNADIKTFSAEHAPMDIVGLASFKKPEIVNANEVQNKAIPVRTGKYMIGDIVLHTKFGRGEVVGLKRSETGTIVSVKFDNGLEKALSADFAPMEVINGK